MHHRQNGSQDLLIKPDAPYWHLSNNRWKGGSYIHVIVLFTLAEQMIRRMLSHIQNYPPLRRSKAIKQETFSKARTSTLFNYNINHLGKQYMFLNCCYAPKGYERRP